MTITNLNKNYWEQRYKDGQTGWDVGYPTPALTDYLSQLNNRNLSVLIPGAGNGYEVSWAIEAGFTNLTVIDIAPSAIENLQARLPLNHGVKLICGDFFEHQQRYDLIVEQTFFCALPPTLRPQYAQHMHTLLNEGGKLAGLLFDFPLTEEGPPFGGSEAEYRGYFEPLFHIKKLERAHNSIKPRFGKELFFIFEKKSQP